MVYNRENKSISKSTFNRFKSLYLLAFLLVLLSVVISQILVQLHLSSQLNDSEIINISGRQRMLSQKLVKSVLLLKNEKSNKNNILNILKEDNILLEKNNSALQDEYNDLGKLTSGNNKIKELFYEVNKSQKAISNSCEIILSANKNDSLNLYNTVNIELTTLLENESIFLIKMDSIVSEFEKESKSGIENLKIKEYSLFILILGILFLTIIFIFIPLSNSVRKIIADLDISDKDSYDKFIEIEDLFKSKEESLQKLKRLNFAINNAVLFASVSEDGTVESISKKFSKLLGIGKSDNHKLFESVFVLSESEKHTINDLLIGKRQSIWMENIRAVTESEKNVWLELTVIPSRKSSDDRTVLVLCTDITQRVESQKELDQLNEDKYEKQIAQQKVHASQIVEAQEEERKRIAKDIHDGIGQMLTALNFNIESINAENVESTTLKIDRLKSLLSTLIKEVRTVTFNLTPPELLDYGIAPTLGKLSDKLSKFTGKSILFENKTDFNSRFDSIVETNLYRVVQEAVNNSLKYANSNYILISVSHTKEMLSIVIDDDGKGFDTEKPITDKKGGGMGMFFMKERISYINGRLFVNSVEGKGTRITINLKME